MRFSSSILVTLLLTVFIAAGCNAGKTAAVKKTSSKGNDPVFATEADKMRFDNLFFDGTRAKQTGQYETAAEKFEQCLTVSPKVPDVYYQLYICYTQLRKPGALAMLDKAIELAPKNTWYLEEKGYALKSMRRGSEAAQVFERLIELEPQKTEHYDNAVELLVMAGKPEKAIDVLDKMETRFGLSEEVIRKKEDLYLYMGKTDKAIAEVQKLVDAVPGNVEYIGMLAELYTMAGKTDKAFEYFNKVLEKDPGNGRAHFGLSNLYRQKGDSANTIKELKLAFEDPNVPLKEKINVILSMAPLGDSNKEYRKQVFELAAIMVDKHPDQPQAHAIFADLLFGDGQYAKAAVEYEYTLKLDPNNYKVWQQLLANYGQLGDYQRLHDESDKALELFPDRVMFYYYNASGAYGLKNYKKAASTAQAGLDLGIGDNVANLGLYTVAGDAYYQLGQYGTAFASLEAALEIDPNNVYVLNNFAYYLAERRQNLEKALSMAKKVLEIRPNEPAYLDTYGWVLYKNERYEDALTYLQKAHNLVPADSEILEHLGDVNYKLGNKAKAVEYWRKSKENGNDSVQLDKKINEGKMSD